MKKLKKKSEEFEIKFWKEWLEADLLKRGELIKKLPIVQRPLKIKDKKLAKDTIAMLLNSYFEDLESAVYTKIRLKNKHNINQK